MSFAKLSSQNMVYQTFNPQTTSTPNTDPSGLFPQFPGQHTFNPYSLPPMPMPSYPFQNNNNPLMMNPMCPPQMNPQQNPSAEQTQQGQLPNGARRKNATRETTATLKAWLYEHRKNPYPTKGEKIMLAIITRMSLNQVSTWFANARRRLKKENKIGGSPKDLDDSDSDDMNSKNKKTSGNNKVSGSTSSDNMNMDDLDDLDDLNDDVTDDEENENNISFNKEHKSLNNPQPIYPNFVPFNKFPNYPQFPLFKPQNLIEHKKEETVVKKPKIWSIADVATKPTTPKTQPISPGRQLNVNLSSSSSSSSSCPSPMKNEQFLAAFSAVINQNSQASSIPASSSPSSTTSTLSNLSTDSPLLNYQQLYYQHLTSQFTNEFLRQSLYQQHQQQHQQNQISNNSSKCEISEMGAKDVNTSKNEQEHFDDVKRVNKRELEEEDDDDDDNEEDGVEHASNSSFQSDLSNTNKKIKLSNESDLSNSSSSSISSQLSPSLKRKLDDSD